MVDIDLPEILSDEFLALIPKQVEQVNQLITQKKIVSYVLNTEKSKLWTIVEGDSEADVIEVLATFPLIQWMDFKIHELMLNYQPVGLFIPRMSLN
ncbi:MAG: hypothetical protein HC880_13015 [Bacteroidia bacterium]|nr:hypothetical protein [Bacteroidia bacterium]